MGRWKNATHRQQWRNTLATYAFPILGDVPVADVTTDLVLKVIEPIWATKTQTASRVCGRFERVLSSAKARGLRDGRQPGSAATLPKSCPSHPRSLPPEHHPALTYKDVPAFMARLRAKQGITALALEFTILMAVRTSEAKGATFDEFDLDAKVWTIPAKRMKAPRGSIECRWRRAVAIVREMATARLNEFTFPAASAANRFPTWPCG
jgi:integrase